MPADTARATPTLPPSMPPAVDERDSVAVYQNGEGSIAVRSTLLESTRPDDLEAAVRALPAPCPTPTYGTFGDRTDVVAIRCTEASPDGAFRPISLYAVHPDGWVDRIEALVDTENHTGETARTAAVAYAEALLATLTAGEAPRPVETGTITIVSACTDGDASDPLTVTLPADWVAIRDTAPEHDLVRLMRVVPLGTQRVMVAIDLTGAETEVPRVPPGSGTHRHGTLLGSDADWLVLHEEGTPLAMWQLASTISVDCGGGTTYARTMRLSLGGPTEIVDPAETVLETMALGGARGHHVSVTPIPLEVAAEEAPVEAQAEGADDHEAEEQSHLWSYAIGGASLLLLAAAMVLRGRTTRPK